MHEGGRGLCRLDGRLACAASLVRQDSVIADIGTDHAYIPVYLLQTGRIRFAVASDINRGPLERARLHAEQYGTADRMRFVLADGMIGLEPERDGVTDFVICGMGGELIARIIGQTDSPKKPGTRLILQPMTAADDLRLFLGGNGYAITDEKLCRAAGKLYTCLTAEYDGVSRTYTPAELLLGPCNIRNRDPLFGEFAAGIAKKLETRIAGLAAGKLDASAERACLEEIESIRRRKQ